MQHLLAAHSAEDAFDPDDSDAPTPIQPIPAGPTVDPTPILGLLDEAEDVCKLPRLHAAAAA